jgi:hypothetical protein
VCKKLRGEKIPHHTRDGKVFIATGATTSTGAPEFRVYDTPEDWEALDKPEKLKVELGIYP